MIYSTVNHQKLPFSDPTHLFDDVILEWSLILFLGNCPTGWINAVGTNDCYLFARNGPGVTWTQAKYYCISVGGKLAEITDQRSQDFVRRYGDPNIFWWLGGYKASNVSVLWDISNIGSNSFGPKPI